MVGRVQVVASNDFERYLVPVSVEGNGQANVGRMAHENWGCKSLALWVVKCKFIHHATSQSECGQWPELDLEETEFQWSLS
jgi:hypothetical protein